MACMKKRNGKWTCISIVFLQSTDHSKRLKTLVTFTHSHTYSYTDGRRSHERCWPAHQKLFRVLYLTQGYFSVQLREIEQATFWLLDDPLNLLSYSRYRMITTRKKLFMHKFLTDIRRMFTLIIYPYQAMKASICTTIIGTSFIFLVL